MRTSLLCRVVQAAALAGVLAAIPATPAHAQCSSGTGQWVVGPGQRYAGPVGTVSAILTADPDGAGPLPTMLLTGGGFSYAGVIRANNFAAWNGTDWITLGEGFNGSVNALAMFNGEVIAAGNFSASGATVCNRIAKWDVAANAGAGGWRPLGAGLSGTVNLGNGPIVESLAVFNGRLHVGGSFSLAGGNSANSIASWDGSVWRPLGTGTVGGGVQHFGSSPFYGESVNALAVFDNRLYVGGRFDRVNGSPDMTTLATWDGTSWASGGTWVNTAVSGGFPEINALSSVASSTVANYWLYAGGAFTKADTTNTSNIALKFKSGTTVNPWAQVGSGLGGPVTAMFVEMGIVSVSAVTASSQYQFGGLPNPNVGTNRFSGGVWNQFAPEQSAALGYNSGPVSGVIGQSNERFVAKRISSEWVPFGNGLTGQPRKVFPGPGGDLYAVGEITAADVQPVGNIARLDSAGAWHPVGAMGLTSVTDAIGFGSDIFVSGAISNSAATKRYTAGTWVFPGGDANGSRNFRVLGADLYHLCGAVYKWNGASFVAQGSAVANFYPIDACIYNNQLHVLTLNGMYRLDGSTWNLAYPLPAGIIAAYRAIVFDGRLFISITGSNGGIFELVGSTFVNSNPVGGFDMIVYGGRLLALDGQSVHSFDGSTWSVVASHAGGRNFAVHNGNLIIGGTTSINFAVSPVFARLVCCPADFDGNGTLAVADIFAFLNAWFAGSPSADFDHLNGLQVADIFAFLNAWFAGC